MKYNIDKANRPVYLQLYRQMRDDIIAEYYPFNTKLPSKRSLADETGVSTITVEHAYALLCDEGYVEARERSGYVVIFRKSDGFAATEDHQEMQKYHKAEQSYPDFPVSVLSKTVRKVLNEYEEYLLEKSPTRGCLELRQSLRRYLARNRGIAVDVDQIVIGAGSEYLYGQIIELLGRERKYAIERPSYHKIERVYQSAEVCYVPLPLTRSGIDSRALAATDADVLHTTPYRSYPSGITATASKLHEYIRWSGKNDRYIIEDDYESEFTLSAKPSETLFALSANDNVIYLNTFSKTISSSLRVGYMVLPKHLAASFDEKMGACSCTVSTLMQYVLTELIDNGDFERHINRVRRKKRKEAE